MMSTPAASKRQRGDDEDDGEKPNKLGIPAHRLDETFAVRRLKNESSMRHNSHHNSRRNLPIQ